MQFTTLLLTAVAAGSAIAADMVTTHVVQVGAANGSLAFFPDSVTAAVGDMVQFQFAPKNHTVTQSTFDQPCQPINMNSNVTGIYSGFMPVSASDTMTPTYTIMINNTTPIWLYCSQGKHCQSGMTMVINENVAKNASRSLANFQALAAKATENLAPSSTSTNGTTGSTSSSSGSSSSSGTSSSGSSSSGSSSTGSSATPNNSTTTGTSGASGFHASSALSLGGALAVAMAILA